MRAICNQVVRYVLASSVGLGTNLGIMTGLVELAALAPPHAAAISTATVLLIFYTVTDRWVFANGSHPTTARGHLRRAASYWGVILGGKAINYAIFLVLVSTGVWYQIAWVLGAALTFAGTFTANRWLWHPPTEVRL